ncbi:MAG TPA: right-handed parallel beta-helix repeat-containing protein [Polyangia bacterium]
MSPSLFRRATLVAALAVLLAPAAARANEYYVSPTGSDSAAGTSAAPFATLSKANSAAAAGDTIWVHGGTYYITSQLTFSKSGTSDSNRTKIWAVAGETPVLDISRYNTTNTAADVPAVLVTGSWMHLRGLEIGNAKVGASGDHSYSLLRTKNASNNTFELLNLHHGFGPGLFVDTGQGGNLILNCDSHDNYDQNGSQGDGQNADGFGVHYQTTGPSTVIRGCRAWNDSDDGYDFISQEVPVTIEDSFAMSNGRGGDGNGNGFKIGSSQTGIRHIVRNNVAWKNKDTGFYANHSTGGNTWYNNTSYMNGTQYDMLASSFDSSGNVTGTITLSGSKAHIMRNNIGFPNRNANMTGVDTMFNTWDLGITEASTDFASTSDTGCTGAREADGSMPAACTFMHLKSGSPLIDKGTNVQLPYVGSAPDLGAYEFGATTTGAGGAGGSGGTTGAGGSTGSGGRGGAGGAGGATAGAGGNTGTAGAGGRGGAGGTATGGRGGAAGSGAGGTSTAGAAGNTGSGGTSAAGAAGNTGSGGTSTAGAAGTTGTGSGGSSATGTAGNGATGTGGSGVTGTGGSSATGSAGTTGTGTGGTSATGAAGSGVTGAAGSGTGNVPGEGGAGGCSCSTSGSPGASLLGLALFAGLLLRPRSRRRRH